MHTNELSDLRISLGDDIKNGNEYHMKDKYKGVHLIPGFENWRRGF